MTAERLAELEAWARAWSRCETVGARFVLELVAEVQRLQVDAALKVMLAPYYPAAVPELPGDELAAKCNAKYQPAPVPPFRGILDGATAVDVYGVQV